MLTLGGITFQGFELPEKINFGGKQQLITHKLPGGGRVIDAMGRDDDDIAWSGRFRGDAAGGRARAVDAMRVAGLPVTLAWDNYRFQVVIAEFKADFERRYEIPYSITCVVLTAQTPPAQSLAGLLATDLSNLADLSGGIAVLTDTVAGVQNAVATARALKSGFASGLPGVLGSIGAARGVVAQLAATAAAAIGTSSGNFATDLLTQAAATADLDRLQQVGEGLGRMATTIQGIRP